MEWVGDVNFNFPNTVYKNWDTVTDMCRQSYFIYQASHYCMFFLKYNNTKQRKCVTTVSGKKSNATYMRRQPLLWIENCCNGGSERVNYIVLWKPLPKWGSWNFCLSIWNQSAYCVLLVLTWLRLFQACKPCGC